MVKHYKTQEGYEIPIQANIQNLSKQSPKQFDLTLQPQEGRWTKWPPEVSSNLHDSMIMSFIE